MRTSPVHLSQSQASKSSAARRPVFSARRRTFGSRPRRWRRRPRTAAALSAAALSVAACLVAVEALTGCAAPSRAETGRGTCTSPGISRDQIQLGMIYPNSGNAASLFGSFRAGVDARFGVANAAGGVRGRKLTYSWQDDESATQMNLAAATALVNSGVFAMLESTSVATGSAAYLHSQGIPVVGSSLEEPWTVYDNMFSYSNLLAASGSVTTYGDFIASHGGHRAVIVVSRFAPASVAFAAELTASLKSVGIPVVATVDATSPINYANLGNQIKDSGADALVGAVAGPAFGQSVLASIGAQAGIKIALSPTGYDPRLLNTFKTILAGAYFVVDFLPFEADSPAHQEFLAAMSQYAPETQPANQQAALAGWISADITLRGLQAAGDCPTRAGLVAALRAVHGYTADGLLTQPVDFRADFGRLTRCLSFVQVGADGQHFTPVDPLPQCGRLISR
ncbi:ABC transporter substrate-binding protein [Pseudofrankia sp. DC12]|uniref:ABC transporter substrate-binding protein n=1 Tax=Pseudofrankia sp. DC12 TaxID=683315 RepID=UPI0005F7FA55|nr:ABC transporter substrate-binding protein [Pseudofrankia sp. DC12]